MDIFLKLDPPTATSQENKTAVVNGRIMHYKSKSAQKTFATLTAALKPFAPAEPMEGPIRLMTVWKFPRGKSHKDGEWKTSRPDTDNLVKALKDVMTRLGFWKDDSQVCCEIISKFWSAEPGIDISFSQIRTTCYGGDKDDDPGSD